MDALRWQRIEAVFAAVGDLPAGEERDVRLAALCEGDAALAADVTALLVEEAHLIAVDDASGTHARAGGGGPEGDPHVGLRVGPYEVVRVVARGGMATVYEGRRVDGTFDQRVAIKIMDVRLQDAALVAQAKAERQILAALEHPAITRLFDGGLTAIGEPYLVMEFVDGQPIDRHCDERALIIQDRVALVREICDGISFAHRALVLHRDLKPSNILVTADGHVKIVDFGTATLLQPERLATVSAAPLTPAYASPEQLTGQPVGTASDQFSLGVVLYELLTGVPAFGMGASLMAVLERALAGQTPSTTTTTITPAAAAARGASVAGLRRMLRGDLGTVVQKALSPEAAGRYASVQHFADDLGRWSRGEPIDGRPPSVAYRTTRFVQRHWAATALATVLAAALTAVTAVSIVQAREARDQEARARQLNQFLTEMLTSANPVGSLATAARSSSLTVREVLDTAAASVGTTLSDTPVVEAEMRLTLGRTYLGIGALAEAESQFTRAAALFGEQDDVAGRAKALAEHGRSRLLRGDVDQAATLLREAVTIERRRGDGSDPAVLTDAMTNLALTIANRRPADPEALAMLREALTVADAHGLASATVASMAQALGNQLMIGGALKESETVLRDALRRADRLAPDHPTRLYVLRSLSELLRTRGEYVGAARIGQSAAEGAARAWPPDYPFQWSFLTTWGRALAQTDDLDRATSVLRDAEARLGRIRPPGHSDFAAVKVGLGMALRRQGNLRDAETQLREGLTVLVRYPAIKHTRAHLLGELGLTLRAEGREGEGAASLRESHALYLELLGDAHPYTVTARARLNGATN